MSYGILGLFSLVGIGVSLFSYSGDGQVFIIISFTAILFLLPFLKLTFINLYLRLCRYPFEFLSVIEQIGLAKDLEISWSNNIRCELTDRKECTNQFLKDNKLSNKIFNRDSSIVILEFHQTGLLFKTNSYSWPKIINWNYTCSTRDEDLGEIVVNILSEEIYELRINLNLNYLKIDKISCLLLLTHFKANYG